MNIVLLKYLVLPIVFVIAGIFFISQWILPLWGEIQVSRTSLATLKATAEFKEKLAKHLESLVQNYDEQKINVDLIGEVAPSKLDEPALLVIFEAIAQEMGMTFKNVVFRQSSPAAVTTGSAKKTLRATDLDIAVRGTYANFKSWLKEVEKELRFFDVNSVTFQSTGSNAKPDQIIDFSIVLTVYFQQ